MKGLLRSKRFRNNLYKWLMMYMGVMLVFTSVVTYSKYISRFPHEENTRMAKFDLKIESVANTNCVSDSTGSIYTCDKDGISPLEDLDYYFKLDTQDLEVQSLVVFNFDVNSKFEIKNILISDNLKVLTGEEKPGINDIEEVQCSSSNCKQLNRHISAASKEVSYYKITLRYKGTIADPKAPKAEEIKDVLKIRYSAIQEK